MVSSHVNVSSAVMAHPSRIDAALQIASSIDVNCSVVIDPDPSGPPTAVRSARIAWKSMTPDATHHLVLQDDVLPTPNLYMLANRAVALFPDCAISLFSEWGSRTSMMLRIAALLNMNFAECADRHLPTPTVILPTRLAREYSTYLSTAEDLPDDNLLMRFLSDHNVRSVVSIPNMVEHLDEVSLVGNGKMGPRLATCFLNGTTHELQPTVLPKPHIVPYFDPDSHTAVYWVIEKDVSMQWQTRPLNPLLRKLGLTERVQSRIFDNAIAKLPSDLVIAMGSPCLSELSNVVIAIALSVLHWSNEPMDQGKFTEAAMESLATLAPGLLRNSVDSTFLVRHKSELAEFTVDIVLSTTHFWKLGILAGFDCWSRLDAEV